jgi:signal transduction histidine kinase
MSQNDHAPSPGTGETPMLSWRALFNARRWSPVPRQSLFLLTALPLALTIPVALIVLVSVGASLLVLGVGVLLLLAAAALARWFGTFELRRLAWAGAHPIEPPDWPALAGLPLGRRITLVLLDRRQWSYIGYTALYLALGTITGSLALVWLASIANGATRWLWNGWAVTTPAELAAAGINLPVLWSPPPYLQGPLTILAYATVGAAALVTLPWFTNAMVGLHDRLARVFLGRFGPEEIDAQMSGLRRSRRASVAAEGRALRKLERDLHDGPQQQLLRLQFDLAAAQRKVASDPEAASRLIAEAGRRSADTLAELRHLVRGLAPPILQDRGLVVALQALAERNPIPTTVSAAIDPGRDIEPAVQQGVYFVVAELLANSVKHSDARRVTITCLAAADGRVLDVTVADDGQGGAWLVPGHGLSGLAERVEGLGGTWTLDSPPGGPTRVMLHIPF